jgi:transcriptional regulator with XRE-family HTH domain
VDSEPPEAAQLATRLRLIRARLGLSQEQLAHQLGVSFATVNRWETGRSQPSARSFCDRRTGLDYDPGGLDRAA